MSNEDKNGLNNGNGSETNGDIPEIELIIKVIIVFNFNLYINLCLFIFDLRLNSFSSFLNTFRKEIEIEIRFITVSIIYFF